MNAQLVGNKIYGEAPSGFSDAETSLERSLSMKELWIAIVFCILFMSVEIAGENAPEKLTPPDLKWALARWMSERYEQNSHGALP
ncbi:hypothetical protein ACH5RR_000210 [Cinchona calisaya]|uniref:Uncharacterized protein n=1 Tax=Cinchona calisaya TaxID=153742 RepID=A0ABD3B055_9GENT